MKYSLFLILIFFLGCTPASRYSSSGKEQSHKTKPQGTFRGMSTNQNLRLGSLLQSYLGKPYAGKSKYLDGLDCSMFTSEVFQKYNNTRLPRTVEEQFKRGLRISKTNLRYGDLVFFRTEGSQVSHVGIFLEHNNFIHVSTSRGVIISLMNDSYWSKRYLGANRIIGVNDGN